MRALSLALQPRSETLLLLLLLLLLLPLPWWHAGAIKDYRIEYNPDLHSHSFEGLAKKLRIMDDEKAVSSSLLRVATLRHAILEWQCGTEARPHDDDDADDDDDGGGGGGGDAQGVRRTAYGGVVTLHKDGARIFVAPQGFNGIGS